MERFFLAASGVFGALGVLLGAFGAHGLKSRLAELPDGVQRLGWWETGAHYHLVHALALALAAYLSARTNGTTAATVAGYAFAAGILLFSGSLYAMTLTGVRVLGAVTPFGGLCFVAGWIAVVVAALRVG